MSESLEQLKLQWRTAPGQRVVGERYKRWQSLDLLRIFFSAISPLIRNILETDFPNFRNPRLNRVDLWPKLGREFGIADMTKTLT